MHFKADGKSSLLSEIKLKFRAKQSSGYTRLYTAYLKIFMSCRRLYRTRKRHDKNFHECNVEGIKR